MTSLTTRLPGDFRSAMNRLAGISLFVAAIVPADMVVAQAPKPAIGGKATAVSFSRQVAPILAKSCGGCHVAGRKGGFHMASYAGLMRSGMVQRGAGNASRLVEVILTGDMPRGGGKVSSADVATLVAWIDAGAAYDAADPTTGIDVLARGGSGPPTPAPASAKPVALEPGAVSFASDVAPLLLATCLKCHGGDETEVNFSMATMDMLLRGGRSGPAVVPGKGGESLLVKKLRGVGIEGQRMPLGRPPLPEADVLLVEKWISEGARLDLLTGGASLENVVAAGQARTLSDADLAKIRFAAGEKLWRRAIPDEQPAIEPRAGVCVIGTLPATRLAELADAAEQVAADVRSQLVTADAPYPLLKGGVVLYAVRQPFDYSALWQNIVGTERPKGIASHAGVSGEVVYGAMLVPAAEADDDLQVMLAETVASAAFAGRGAPAWFSRGAGRAVAGRIMPKATAVKQWKKEAASAVPRLGSTADFLAGLAEPAASAAAAGGFVGTIAPGGRLAQMLGMLDTGASFDEAFARVFRATPAQAFERWVARAPR